MSHALKSLKGESGDLSPVSVATFFPPLSVCGQLHELVAYQYLKLRRRRRGRVCWPFSWNHRPPPRGPNPSATRGLVACQRMKYEQERQDKEKSNSVCSSERLCSHLVGDDSGSVLGAGQSPNLASEAHLEELIDADCVGDNSSAALDFSLGSDSYLVNPNGLNDAQPVEEPFDRVSEDILSYNPEEVHSQEWNPTRFTGEDNDLTPSVESGDHQYSSPQNQGYTEFTSGRFESDVVAPAYYTHLGRRSRSHAEITLEDTEGPGGSFDDEGNLNQQRMPSDSSVIRSEPESNPFAVEAMDTEEDGIPLWALTHLRDETIRPQVSPRSLTHSEHVWLQEACDAWGAGRFGQPPWQGFVTSARNAEGIAHHSILEEYLETVSNYGGAEFF
ncbi:hypothetical protein CLU79DRAFT_840991 [Phycomyces nitens]|nr:hypothetical protein CLU79DRAFT_840991 [Phycomyces nitens]